MQHFLQFIHAIDPTLLGALGFLIGVLVGNWIAIGRDKRQEFNIAVKPMRAHIISIRDNPHAMQALLLRGSEIDLIQHYMMPLRRWRFAKAVKRYERCHEQQTARDPQYGSLVYTNPAVISECASDVLAYLKFR